MEDNCKTFFDEEQRRERERFEEEQGNEQRRERERFEEEKGSEQRRERESFETNTHNKMKRRNQLQQEVEEILKQQDMAETEEELEDLKLFNAGSSSRKLQNVDTIFSKRKIQSDLRRAKIKFQFDEEEMKLVRRQEEEQLQMKLRHSEEKRKLENLRRIKELESELDMICSEENTSLGDPDDISREVETVPALKINCMTKERTGTVQRVDQGSYVQSNVNSGPCQNDTANVNQLQHLIEVMQAPRADISPFDGDPIKYHLFMRTFDNAVDSTSLSACAKLTRLVNLCTGQARSVTEGCLIMEPSAGYAKARKLLKSRFGHDYAISKAWIDKTTDRRQLKPNEPKSLRKYADDLQSCKVIHDALGSSAIKELDTMTGIQAPI